MPKLKEMPKFPMAKISAEETNKTGGWRTLKPILDKEKCTKCMICWKFCPELSIDIIDEYPVIDYIFCKGCGICANECPKKCIEMVKE